MKRILDITSLKIDIQHTSEDTCRMSERLSDSLAYNSINISYPTAVSNSTQPFQLRYGNDSALPQVKNVLYKQF